MAVEIFSATGGNGLGFSINNFTGTQIQWNVPTTSFDIYMRSPEGILSFSRTYTGTTTQPDGLYEITLAEMQAVGSWPATYEGQIYVRFEPESGGFVETNVSIRDTTPLNAANLNAYIEQWWETNVRPELEAINTTLQSILAQHTTVATNSTTIATEITTIDANVNRIRILGDWGSYTDGQALGQGFKTSGLSSYNNIEKASLYKSLVLEGGILTYNRGIAEQNLSVGPIDPPQGIQQAAIDRIAALADEFDEVAVGTIPATNLPDDFEGNF
jgi:hypothetical protein